MSARSGSITPPVSSSSTTAGTSSSMISARDGKKRNSANHGQHRVEFSPVSSSNRRGSSSTTSGSAHHKPHPKLQSRESVDRDKQRRLEMVERAKERREAMLKRVRMEKKVMLLSSILAFLAMFIWFAAVFTDHWFYLNQSEEAIERELNSSTIHGHEVVFITSNTGLWRTCEHFRDVQSETTKVECAYFSIFLSSRDEANGPDTLNEHVIDYTRAQICFAFISVLLMTMTIVAAFYTFKNSRYVYKRLAACLYFMTTISVLVVLEVLVTSVNYAEDHKLYPPAAVVQYGFSFYMGWSVFVVYLVNGCIFLILSRKRKYDKDEDDADGEFIVGR